MTTTPICFVDTETDKFLAWQERRDAIEESR